MADMLQKAEALFRAGRSEDGRKLLDAVIASNENVEVKLKAILLKLEIVDLNILTDLKRSCDEGIAIANAANKKNELAYFLVRKAALLAFDLGFFQKRFRELKLSPTWFEFSLESDRDEFNEIEKAIETTENEIQSLVSKARLLAKETGDPRTNAHLSIQIGSLAGQQYFSFKLMNMKATRINLILWSLGIRTLLTYSRNERRRLHYYRTECLIELSNALEIFRSLKEEINVAIGYQNIALWNMNFGSFRKARKYVRLARVLAEKENYPDVLAKISLLEKSIEAKNKDIPNYSRGERRR